jgi:hypothetical protein
MCLKIVFSKKIKLKWQFNKIIIIFQSFEVKRLHVLGSSLQKPWTPRSRKWLYGGRGLFRDQFLGFPLHIQIMNHLLLNFFTET